MFKAFLLLSLLLAGCGIASTRPVRQMNYAEAAFRAATTANAELKYPAGYLLAKDTLERARSAYRLKNFKEARRFAVRARRLSEEAEFQSLFGVNSEKVKANPNMNADDLFKKEETGEQ